MRISCFLLILFLLILCPAPPAAAAAPTPEDAAAVADNDGQLHIVATAHLDTQWRWTIQETINEFILNTLLENFALIEKYPSYVFSFEGSFRYELMEEYYPEEFERLCGYIAQDRWRVAGSWVDAVDTNIPSPEALIRHTLYGNGYFRRTFGKTSREIFLPDCFGFSYSLPSIAAHSGLLGFTTQKLTWGCWVGIPFDIGLWEGVDGSTVIAAVNPGSYGGRLNTDISADSTWIARAAALGRKSGLYAGYKYIGTGDTGGSPDENTVAWLERSISGEGPLRVRSVGSDQLMREVTPEQQAGLPRFKGEMVMTRHGIGCYTSQAAMKRWNRQNEILATAAEQASVLAHWLGAAEYPRETLRKAWTRFLWHGFHDDLTGTSIPEAYAFSWNDEILSLNEFDAMLTEAVGGVSRAMDTRVKGEALLVFNPLSWARQDIVQAHLDFDGDPPAHLRVFDPDGDEVPAQSAPNPDGGLDLVFLADLPSAGYVVYDVRSSRKPCTIATGLSVTSNTLENNRYRVRLDGFDVVSVFDKPAGRELLAGPHTLQMLDDSPARWAAWEIDYDDIMAAPRTVVGGDVTSEIVESGPARVSLALSCETENSGFRRVISLSAGEAGELVELDLDLDWRTKGTLLKANFNLATGSDEATYDLRLGAIRRGVNTATRYEVPAQRWADLGDSGYGVAIMNDSRYGWDHPDPNTLRLSLVRTPEISEGWSWLADEQSQDLGRHRIRYAFCGHGDGNIAAVNRRADRFNQPPLAFHVPEHKGELGKRFSLLSIEGAGEAIPAVAVRAVKYAEESNEVVVRLQELAGEETGDLSLRFSSQLTAAREINGAEEPLGPAVLINGALPFTLTPWQPRSFALRLGDAPQPLIHGESLPLELPFNIDGISTDDDRLDGDFDGLGHTLASEVLPAEFEREGIRFKTGPRESGWANIVACDGQMLDLPADCDRLYILASAVGGGRRATFEIAGEPTEIWIQDWARHVGQWANRLHGGLRHDEPGNILPAYINRDTVAWIGTHRHDPEGENEAYVFSYMFRYRLDLPRRAGTLRLPDDPRIRIMAITAVRGGNDVARAAQPLYDRSDFTTVEIRTKRTDFLDAVTVSLVSPNPDPEIRYTLDGGAPTRESLLYSGPFTLTADTPVRARAYSPGLQARYTARADFRKLAIIAPVQVAAMSPGLDCRYYEGAWEMMPDFTKLTSVEGAIIPDVGVPEFANEEDIGLVLAGYLNAPRRGMYRLHLYSDDGSTMYHGDELIIDNDGLHGRDAVWVDLPLEEGPYPIRVEFFQHLGGVAFELWWEGPGIPLQQVPPEAFSH
ncbi:MAG: alpha-mannosidase [bacterium]|nr:alpha-mannosidase [bacterium]